MRRMRSRTLLVIAAVFCVSVPVSSLCVLANGEPVEKDWAVYIYCGADNDFDISAEFARDQCVKGLYDAAEAVATAPEPYVPISMHVVMYLDLKGTGNTEVYEITADEANPVDMMDNGEYDSSEGATLVEFLSKAMVQYPGTNTMLIVKNGHAWCGVCPDDDNGEANYLMPVNELASVLGSEGIAGGIDVLVLDGDNMASIEVAYELRNSCDYFVASQQDVPVDGFPYYLFMKEMAMANNLDSPEPAEAAECMVNNYVYYYNNTEGKKVLLDHLLSNSQMAVTASAFKMTGAEDSNNMETIVDAFKDCLDWLMTTEVTVEVEGEEYVYPWMTYYRNVIASARDTALIGKMADQAGYEWLPDVYTWLEKIIEYSQLEIDPEDPEQGPPDVSGFEDRVDQFTTAFDAALVYMEQCQILNRSGNSFPHGLNIWFPPTWLQWDDFDYTRTRTYLYDGAAVETLPAEYYCVDCPFDYNNIDLDFVDATSWMDFLTMHYESRWSIYGYDNPAKQKPTLPEPP